MGNDIFRKLVIAFIIAFVVSMAYGFIKYQSIDGLEKRQGGFLLLALIFH